MTITYQKIIQFIVVFLPIISIFLTGQFFPVNNQPYKPIFQPPNYVFPIIWTYITLTVGYFSNQLFIKGNYKYLNVTLYLIILVCLNSWLVIYHNKKYKFAFSLLVATSYLSVIYMAIMANQKIKYSYL